MILKKFNAMSVAKVSGLLYGLLGLLVGAFVALMSLIGSGTAAMAAKSGKPLFGLLLGAGAVSRRSRTGRVWSSRFPAPIQR